MGAPTVLAGKETAIGDDTDFLAAKGPAIDDGTKVLGAQETVGCALRQGTFVKIRGGDRHEPKLRRRDRGCL